MSNYFDYLLEIALLLNIFCCYVMKVLMHFVAVGSVGLYDFKDRLI